MERNYQPLIKLLSVMFISNGFRLGNVNLFQRTTNAGKFIVNNSIVKMIYYTSVIFGTSGVKISDEHYKP